MASYKDIVQEIEKLQKEADRRRKLELASVIKSIRKQIADHGLTPQDLGFEKRATRKDPSKAAAARKPRKGGSRAGTKGMKVAPKFRDQNNNTWSGRGKMPKWLSLAISQGASLDHFRI